MELWYKTRGDMAQMAHREGVPSTRWMEMALKTQDQRKPSGARGKMALEAYSGDVTSTKWRDVAVWMGRIYARKKIIKGELDEATTILSWFDQITTLDRLNEIVFTVVRLLIGVVASVDYDMFFYPLVLKVAKDVSNNPIMKDTKVPQPLKHFSRIREIFLRCMSEDPIDLYNTFSSINSSIEKVIDGDIVGVDEIMSLLSPNASVTKEDIEQIVLS